MDMGEEGLYMKWIGERAGGRGDIGEMACRMDARLHCGRGGRGNAGFSTGLGKVLLCC